MSVMQGIISSKPKHVQVADIIREQIRSGAFSKGTRLLPDEELAQKYQVNRNTIAVGLNALVKEGLLERAPRRGTIVIRDMKKGKSVSNAVGMVMFSKGDVYGDICRKISECFMHRKLYPVLINESVVVNHQDSVITYLDHMTSDEQRPYGFIIDGNYGFPFAHLKSNPERFENIVFITKYHYPEKIKSAKYVLVDFAAAGRLAAQHFISKGYKKLACLAVYERDYAGPWSSVQEMIMQGFADACRAANIAFDEEIFWKLLHGAPFSETVAGYLKGKERPDAFFCYQDSLISHNILPVLNELGINYPKDIEFIGFYNTHDAEKCGFSSICINEEEIAETAVKLLTNETDEQEVLIQPELIIRQPKY